jgi:two-component system, sensor histidine kinase
MSQSPVLLTIDDNAAGRYFKTRVLREAGYIALEAETGQEGLALTASKHPDLVLLDINLPDVDGVEVCELIKRDFPGTLVLGISAVYTEVTDRVRCLQRGADAYLVEPVEPQELLATVHALLRIRKAEQELRVALQRNELLLDELRHRMKNSLQLVTSMLRLQAEKISDPDAKLHFKVATNRIGVLAKLYDLLYVRHGDDWVQLDRFLSGVVESCKALTDAIHLECRAESVKVSVDQAIPIGLVAQELITNALKHAFPVDARGRISVALSRQDGTCRLQVTDNGVGVSAKQTTGGSGSRLVLALTEQLGGTARYSSGLDGKGTSVTIEFPIPGEASSALHN